MKGTRSALVGALLLFVGALAACEARPVDRAPEAASPGASAPSPAPPPVIADPAPGRPALLTTACVRGDVRQGVAYALEGVGARATPLTAVALASLAPGDSARLAARLTRTVDAMAVTDAGSADFRGLPITVRAAWRLLPSPDDSVVVALVARRQPIESDPREELFFLVATPAVIPGVRGALVERWAAREEAAEDLVATRELVAALAVGDTLALVVAHESADGVQAELVTRVGTRWSLAWRGPVALCAP